MKHQPVETLAPRAESIRRILKKLWNVSSRAIEGGSFLLHQPVLVDERGVGGSSDWLMWDNGGEVDVQKVNFGADFHASVPLNSRINDVTVAYRIAMKMRSCPIDYDFTLSDEDLAVMMGAR